MRMLGLGAVPPRGVLLYFKAPWNVFDACMVRWTRTQRDEVTLVPESCMVRWTWTQQGEVDPLLESMSGVLGVGRYCTQQFRVMP